MKNSWIVLAVMLPLGIYAQGDGGILDRISASLPAYMSAFPPEKVYLNTDKEVYAPGEIIWFKAQIFSRAGFTEDQLSPELTVSLYDAAGQFIGGDKFLVANGELAGDMRLPELIPLGQYFLVAHTPMQEKPEEVFVKAVTIDQSYDSEFRVLPADPDEIYTAGKEASLKLAVTDFYGNPSARNTFHYWVTHGDQIISKGKARAVAGSAQVRFRMPEKTGREPVVLNMAHPRNLWRSRHALRSTADELSVEFYPEGGNILENIPVKMGFFIASHHGNPVNAEAEVRDETGQTVTMARTFSPGLGMFPFKQEPGKSYRLVITSEYGRGQSFELPGTETGRVALAVTRMPGDLVYADLYTADENPVKVAIAVTGNSPVLEWAAYLDVARSARVRLPVEDMGAGIKLVSVFDMEGTLLASRIIIVPDRKRLEIEVTPEVLGEQVRMTFSARNEDNQPVAAALTVSVADRNRKAAEGIRLQDWRILGSELKNPVLPLSEVSQNQANFLSSIDYLLIANNLKGFSWDRILEYGTSTGEFNILSDMGVRGKVVNRRGTAVPGAKVSLLNSRNMQMYTATADASGSFVFPALNPVDLSDYSVTATSENGRKVLQVEMEPSFSGKIGLMVRDLALGSSRGQQFIPDAPYYAANPELIVKAPSVIRPVSPGQAKGSQESYKTLLQTGTSLADVIKIIKPYTLVNNQIVFPGTQNSFLAQTGALIIIDGQKMGTQVDVLGMISPHDVDNINISLDPVDIQQYTGLNNVGIIEITTKRGGRPSSVAVPASAARDTYVDGYRVPRSFLTTESLRPGSGKDLRTTLYWNPSLQLGPDGKAVFSVPLSDIRSGFVISAVGIDSEGATGEGSATFDVR